MVSSAADVKALESLLEEMVSSTVAVQVNQLWQPGLRSAGCGTPGNAWRSAVSSSGTSVGSFQSKLSRNHNYKN